MTLELGGTHLAFGKPGWEGKETGSKAQISIERLPGLLYKAGGEIDSGGRGVGVKNGWKEVASRASSCLSRASEASLTPVLHRLPHRQL